MKLRASTQTGNRNKRTAIIFGISNIRFVMRYRCTGLSIKMISPLILGRLPLPRLSFDLNPFPQWRAVGAAGQGKGHQVGAKR